MMSDCPSLALHPFIRGPARDRVRRYRERAARLRGMAKDFSAPEWCDILLRLAATYEELAENTREETVSLQ